MVEYYPIVSEASQFGAGEQSAPGYPLRLVTAALVPAASARIVLVRHGQAEPKKGWPGADADRPLVGRGRLQAQRLSQTIGRLRPDRVISSPALRCVETVELLAESCGLPLEISEQWSIEAGQSVPGLGQNLIDTTPDGSTLVVCTHREVLVRLIPELSRRGKHKIGHRPPGAKGGVWILRFRHHHLTRVDYRPPEP